ncbi:MAG: DNA gyrase inhibitor YacG [Pseudomonadota bacterium]
MTCPICNRKTEQAHRPFCSKRCADVDLGRWMTGAYAVPTDEQPKEEPAPEPPKSPLH